MIREFDEQLSDDSFKFHLNNVIKLKNEDHENLPFIIIDEV